MIQFNLLPDVKLQYIKATRTKHIMELVSTVVIAGSLVVFALMISAVDIVQKKSLSDLNKDIATYSKQLKQTPELNKILTVQNQLNTLDGLHSSKAVASRLFPYLTEITPANASISNLSIDFVANTVTISGQASAIDVINTYVDTLKATTYTTDTDTAGTTHAFNNIVLTSFSRSDKGASFSISASFDPIIFSNTNTVTLKVPAGSTVDPSALFKSQTGGV